MFTDLMQIVSSLAIPVIGGIAAYVAWQQWVTNRLSLREKLFERRFACFKKLHIFLSRILEKGEVDEADFGDFAGAHQEPRFLFGKCMQDYYLEVYKHAIEAMKFCDLADDSEREERKKNIEKKYDEIGWLIGQLDGVFERFDEHLSLRDK